MTKAYEEGIQAFKRGDSLADCPYAEGTMTAEDWYDGYEHAFYGIGGGECAS